MSKSVALKTASATDLSESVSRAIPVFPPPATPKSFDRYWIPPISSGGDRRKLNDDTWSTPG